MKRFQVLLVKGVLSTVMVVVRLFTVIVSTVMVLVRLSMVMVMVMPRLSSVMVLVRQVDCSTKNMPVWYPSAQNSSTSSHPYSSESLSLASFPNLLSTIPNNRGSIPSRVHKTNRKNNCSTNTT